MKRNVYFFILFLLGLLTAAGLLQSIFFLLLGAPIFYLDSFKPWFLVMNTISVSSALFILKYYHHKNYSVAFFTGIVYTMTNLFFYFVFYQIIASRQFESYYIPALFLYLGSGMVYGLSLIFSNAGKKTWLKLGGICIVIVGLVLASIFILATKPEHLHNKEIFEKIDQWISLAASLIPVLFILNFVEEIKRLKEVDFENSLIQFSKSSWGVVGMVAFIFILAFGGWIASESYSRLHWESKNREKTKATLILLKPLQIQRS